MSAENRVMGIESEYGLTYAFSAEQLEERARHNLPPQVWGADPGSAISTTYARYLPDNLPVAAKTPTFLGNGMRLYEDVGSHPEAAGAESTEVQDIIDGDLAADKLLWRALRSAYKDGAIRNFMLLRRTIDVHGTSWGRHENYRMNRELILAQNADYAVSMKKMAPLVAFLAVRPMTGGAGCVHNGEYWMGQKIVTAVEDVSSDTTRSKPLVNTRDEPLGIGYRQHVVCVDFPSPHVTALNLETTSLVARMIEHGMAPRLQTPYPNWAFFGRSVATDMSLSYAATISGKTMTGLNVHEEFLAAAHAMPDELLSPAEQRGRAKWEAIYQRLKAARDDIGHGGGSLQERAERIQHAFDTHLAGHLDWVDRMSHIEGVEHVQAKLHKQHEDGVAFSYQSAAASQADITYDLVGKGTGLSRTYVDRLAAPQAAPYVNQQRIEHRILHAPATGRAALREKFIYEFDGDPNVFADWGAVGYDFVENGQLRGNYHYLKDPEALEDSAFNTFMARVRHAQPASIALYERRQRERQRLAM